MLLRGRAYVLLILLSVLMSCSQATEPLQGLFIARFSPDSVDGGELDTLYGYGFGTLEDSVTAMLGSVKLQTVLANELMLVVRVPEAAETAKLTVTRGGLTAESKNELVVRHSTRVSSKGLVPRSFQITG